MKKIYRSIINIKKSGTPTIPTEDLFKNYKLFLSSNIKPEDPSFIKLYHWIEAHFRSYKDLPSIELLYEKAQQEGDEVVLANLKDIAVQTPYTKSDYRAILKEKSDEQNSSEFREILNKTWQVVNSGLKLKKKEIKGVTNAIEYFSNESRKFRINYSGVKTDSQIRTEEDKNEVLDEYEKRKKDPINNWGMFSFLEKMDDTYRGIKLGQLMVIAAYVAQGKTTFAANMAYNGIIQGLNGMFVAMEMNFVEMRDLIYTMHTCNHIWYDHPKYKNLCGKISYEKVCYGELNDLEKEFFEYAANDLVNQDKYGELIIHQPTDTFTPSRLELELIDRQAELDERGKKIDFLIIDYVGLMLQDKAERYGDFNADLNNIIKRLKHLTMNFDNGRGLRIITPFQVNREGWKDAVKNDGVYKLTALSNANEGERAADQVISLFMSEENRKSGIVKITCLKNRRGPMFSPFEACIDFTSRRLRDAIERKPEGAPGDDMQINEIPLDN
jgi:replicative DNA helicase